MFYWKVFLRPCLVLKVCTKEPCRSTCPILPSIHYSQYLSLSCWKNVVTGLAWLRFEWRRVSIFEVKLSLYWRQITRTTHQVDMKRCWSPPPGCRRGFALHHDITLRCGQLPGQWVDHWPHALARNNSNNWMAFLAPLRLPPPPAQLPLLVDRSSAVDCCWKFSREWRAPGHFDNTTCWPIVFNSLRITNG